MSKKLSPLRSRCRPELASAVRGALALCVALVITGCRREVPDNRSLIASPRSPSPSGSPAFGRPEESPGSSAAGPASSSPATGATPPLPGSTVPAGVPPGVQAGFVAKHVDGDTIWVEIREPGPLVAGAVHKIRILEIDTPESTSQKECFGEEASEFAKRELPLGSKVYLLADRADKDRFGRYLRYVWTQKGEFYNEKAIREGLAKAVLYPPNDLYINHLRAVERQARQSSRGLWQACAVRS